MLDEVVEFLDRVVGGAVMLTMQAIGLAVWLAAVAIVAVVAFVLLQLVLTVVPAGFLAAIVFLWIWFR